MLTEEQKLSLQAGEFIHSIANHLADGAISLDEVSPLRATLIMELSEILRQTKACDHDAPLLLAEGFHVSRYPRSTWIDLAGRLLDAPLEKPLVEVFKQLPATRDDEELNELLVEFKNEDISSSSRSIYESIALALFVFLLFFLFWGEPDVWDSLRNHFMNF